METVMDQPSSASALSLHPEADVRKQRANSDVVRTHLYNHGLRLPGVEIAPDTGTAHRRRCLEALALC